MTGAEVCRALLARIEIPAQVAVGPTNHYANGERIVFLREHCYHGTSKKNRTLAAHEAGHAAQEARYGWLAPALRWLVPGRLLLEWDASRRAREMLLAIDEEADEPTLLSSWHSYLWPAVWQTGLLVAIAVAAVILRG